MHSPPIVDAAAPDRLQPPVTREHQPARPRSALDLLPSIVAIALLVIALASNGAFPVQSWAPIAVIVAALLAFSPLWRLDRRALIAVGAVWAFAVWTALSALWSPSPGAAMEGAARAVLYAALFTVPLATLPDRLGARRVAMLIATALAGAVVVTFVLIVARGDELFLAGRLDSPIGYRNGTAALFVLAFFPLVCAAAAREVRVAWRTAAFAIGVVALALAFLTQSRGAVIGFACGAVAVLVVGPERVRRAWMIVAAVALLALFSEPLLDPYNAFIDRTDVSAAIDDATTALITLAVIGTVLMLFAAIFDRGLRVAHETRRRLRIGAGWGLVAAAVVAAVAALAVVGNPVDYASDRFDEFKSLDTTLPGETRLGSAGGQRYDLWRIATDEFADNPLVGAGEGSYPFTYYRERETDRNLLDPHSLPLRVAAELGIVGVALLLAWLIAGGTAAARGRTRPEDLRWLAAMGAVAAAFFGQTIVDWLALIPGVAGFAALALGAAAALGRTESAEPAVPRGAGIAVRVACVVAAIALTAFYLSDYEVREARASVDPQAQLDAAERAETLNPLALPPRLLQAGALEDLGRRDEARRALEEALDLERSFVVMALIGDLEMRAGREEVARRWYRRALELNPGDVGLQSLAANDTK